MKSTYSQYARDAHSMIQSLNDDLQNHIDRFYADIGNSDNFFNELKAIIFMHMNDLNDLCINYFTHIYCFYRGFDECQKFELSRTFEDLIDIHIDLTNANFNMNHFSNIINTTIIRYVNLKAIYENIIQETDKLNMSDDTTENWVYTTDDLIDELSIVFSDSYDCFKSLRNLCHDETDILYSLNYYIHNIQVISYIIEFIESIRVV